ncbi:uncharacterized protein LOC117215648 [Bombus bifarius]|uniref:Uncharacterized protein LOC117215648 n=1 Tax=Bombus bifarius TaxID=103933 RepID=A0A6P8NC76_9HYME|nr:uncharacterized protein LOC117215648 [Bombus bifarius]
MPIHIKAWLRWRQYEVKKMYNQNPEEAASIWMEEMKVLETQVQRRSINYETMQILTGHGIFNWYRHRIGKESHTSCWDCGAELDDTEHVLFWCPRWAAERAELEAEIGEDFAIENRVVEKIATEEGIWRKFSLLCTKAMRCRLRKGREMERMRRVEDGRMAE